MSAVDVAQRAGVTYRQLDHWFRLGYLSANGQPTGSPGSGHDREFTYDEVRRLTLLARLVSAGVKPSKAAQYARTMVACNTRTLTLPGPVTITVGMT